MQQGNNNRQQFGNNKQQFGGNVQQYGQPMQQGPPPVIQQPPMGQNMIMPPQYGYNMQQQQWGQQNGQM